MPDVPSLLEHVFDSIWLGDWGIERPDGIVFFLKYTDVLQLLQDVTNSFFPVYVHI